MLILLLHYLAAIATVVNTSAATSLFTAPTPYEASRDANLSLQEGSGKVLGNPTEKQLPLTVKEKAVQSKEEEDNYLEATSSPPATSASPDVAVPSSDEAAQQKDATESEALIQAIIRYDAKDSIVLDIKRKAIRLYGEGVIEYDTIKLEADKISLDWKRHIISAASKKNEAGELERKPILTKDGVEYIAERVRYNFESHRAVASKLFTKQGDGIIRANKAKKDSEDTFYADRATYTTCNLVRPHFHISAKQLKLVYEDKIMSGPFSLYFDNVPTPLGFFFGIFYFPNKRSGVIFPKYGGENEKGFSIKDGGYYFNFNDYVDLALTGEIYSKGSTGFTAQSYYKKRYQYSGALAYQRSVNLATREDTLPQKDKSWRFQWKHRTENNRNSSVAAEVDLQNESFKKSLVASGEDLNATMNSSIRYTNRLIGFPYALNVNLRHSKNFITQDTRVILPDISLRTENIYSFRKKGTAGGHWYSDIYFQHMFEFRNELSNKVGKETIDFSPQNWPIMFKNAKYGAKHTVPIKTNVKISYLNLTPFIEYRERWYWEKINYDYNTNTGQVDKEKVKGFARVYDYEFGTALTTTLYGTHFFKRNATVQAIRHQIEPSVSFTYTPDFSKPKFGYWQKVQKGTATELKNKFEGGLYGTSPNRAQAVMQVKLNNTLEMKVRSKTEEGIATKKIPILEGFDWSTSYDFLKDNFKLGDIHLDARTRLFEGLFNITLKTTFDPYVYVKSVQGGAQREDRVNEFAWNHGKGLGHVNQASLNISTKFSADKSKAKDREQHAALEDDPNAKEELKNIQEHPEQYIDFNIPWALGLNYAWSYSSPKPKEGKSIKVFSFHGDVSLTEKWKASFQSGYDITKGKFVGSLTKLGIHRDLHCWEMNFNWRPLGKRQYYEFSVGVKSPLLRDLRYNRNRGYPSF